MQLLTLFNKKKRIQGLCDAPLTPLGIEQATYSAQHLKKLSLQFDHAYSSTSERACDTLELVTTLPYKRLKGLKEWNFGFYEGEPEYLNPPLEEYSAFFSAHGGETRKELTTRINQTLLEIMNHEDHQNVLVVSHGGAIRNFQKYWCPNDKHLIPDRIYNAALLFFEFDSQTQTFTFTDIFNPNYQGKD